MAESTAGREARPRKTSGIGGAPARRERGLVCHAEPSPSTQFERALSGCQWRGFASSAGHAFGGCGQPSTVGPTSLPGYRRSGGYIGYERVGSSCTLPEETGRPSAAVSDTIDTGHSPHTSCGGLIALRVSRQQVFPQKVAPSRFDFIRSRGVPQRICNALEERARNFHHFGLRTRH